MGILKATLGIPITTLSESGHSKNNTGHSYDNTTFRSGHSKNNTQQYFYSWLQKAISYFFQVFLGTLAKPFIQREYRFRGWPGDWHPYSLASASIVNPPIIINCKTFKLYSSPNDRWIYWTGIQTLSSIDGTCSTMVVSNIPCHNYASRSIE